MARTARQLFKNYYKVVVLAVVTATVLRGCLFSVLYLPEKNMEPGLLQGDFILGHKWVYGWPLPLTKGQRLWAQDPHRGDVVSLTFPGDENQILIRRVIAVAGDRVEVKNGDLWLNGKKASSETLPEGQEWQETLPAQKPYLIRRNPERQGGEVQVPEGHFFVLSDNRENTDDSFTWGAVPYENLHSRIWRVWLSIDNGESSGFGFRWERFFYQVH